MTDIQDDDSATTDDSTEDEIKFARLQGWTPKDEYTGDPDSFKTAKQFIEYGRSHNRVLKQNNDKLLDQVKELQATMQQLVADSQTQKQRAVEKAIAELKEQKAEAIRDSDGEAVNKIDDEIDKLKQAKTQETPQPNPLFEAWLKDNPWYSNDKELQVEADMYAQLYINSNRLLPPEDVYKAVTKRIKKEFPDRFENPNKREPAIATKGIHTKPSKGKTYNDLPPDAKQACDRFCKNIPGFTKEKYLSTYEWE